MEILHGAGASSRDGPRLTSRFPIRRCSRRRSIGRDRAWRLASRCCKDVAQGHVLQIVAQRQPTLRQLRQFPAAQFVQGRRWGDFADGLVHPLPGKVRDPEPLASRDARFRGFGTSASECNPGEGPQGVVIPCIRAHSIEIVPAAVELAINGVLDADACIDQRTEW